MWPMEHNSDDKKADDAEEAARKESPAPRLTSSYDEGELFDKIIDNEVRGWANICVLDIYLYS